MQINRLSNVTEFPRRASPANAVDPWESENKYLTEIIGADNRLPISLSINSESILILNTVDDRAVEVLRKEMQLWAKLLGNRTVSNFELIHPALCFQPFELTSLVHCVASTFNVSSLDSRQHRAVCSMNEINSDALALLKGLGFTQIQVRVPQQSSLTSSEFHQRFIEISDFHFDFVGIQLAHTDCLDQLAPRIHQFSKACNPDYIFVGPHSLNMTLNPSDKGSARLIVDPGKAQASDCLNLGPESVTIINGHTFTHLCSPQRYQTAVMENRLPLHIKQPEQG